MEKTTKKRKKSKRLKKRIGLVVIGGLSLVLTVCLSVGATLAWFAGSTWASNDMYMGGPVYVEMAGRGTAGYSNNGTAANGAIWNGGTGTLDIVASGRSSGTVATDSSTDDDTYLDNIGNILLPGQKLLIYSQARVFSTLQTSTINNGQYPNNSSGSNNSNVSDGTAWYYDGSGRAQTATTSVLRAKFSIDIEFDPSVGFNNFTDAAYVTGYPVQSTDYKGAIGTYVDYTVSGTTITPGDPHEISTTATTKADMAEGDHGYTTGTTPNTVQWMPWETSLGATLYKVVRTRVNKITVGSTDYTAAAAVAADLIEEGTAGDVGVGNYKWKNEAAATENGTQVGKLVVFNKATVAEQTFGRRDAVENPKVDIQGDNVYNPTTGALESGGDNDEDYWVADRTSTTELWRIKNGQSKSIYKWKYVSKSQYEAAPAAQRMAEPFNGKFNSLGNASSANGGTGNGYYGLWEMDGNSYLESDAYYKERTRNYLQSYVEHYLDDYNRDLVLQIGSSIDQLENTLNNSFVKLVNQSSDNIIAGHTKGFTADSDGKVTYTEGGTSANASWLYVDPVIGNDTNDGDSATSVGGWWYLVSSNSGSVTTNLNEVNTVVDVVSGASKTDSNADTSTTLGTDGRVVYNFNKTDFTSKNTPAAANTAYATSSHTASATNAAKVSDTFKRFTSDMDKTATATAAAITAGSILESDDVRILNAKLYEISPNIADVLQSTNPVDGTTTTKVVSMSFPFVNGNFELPGKELTNIFANAKISFKITFQALQAFFPFTDGIDGCGTGTALAGTGKALNIGNSIPIFNEAFDYLTYLDNADYRP